jgi:hypothetical protein
MPDHIKEIMDRLNDEQKEYMVFAINKFGSSGVYARRQNLPFFVFPFVKKILEENVDNENITEEGKKLTKEILEIMNEV